MSSNRQKSQTNESKSNEMSKFYHAKFDDILSLSSETYLQNKNDYLLVDVRSPAEQKISMIPGAITMKEFESNCGQQHQRRIQDDNLTVVTYCTVGYRSGMEGRRLREEYNLHGKIMNLDGIVCYTHACEKFMSSGNDEDTSENDVVVRDNGDETFLVNAKNQSTRTVHVFGDTWNYAASSFEAVYFSKITMAVKGVGVVLRGFFQYFRKCCRI